jgi:transposase InsO family protein
MNIQDAYARDLIDRWQEYYDERRPHGALGYMAPAEYRRAYGEKTAPRMTDDGRKLTARV